MMWVLAIILGKFKGPHLVFSSKCSFTSRELQSYSKKDWLRFKEKEFRGILWMNARKFKGPLSMFSSKYKNICVSFTFWNFIKFAKFIKKN